MEVVCARFKQAREDLGYSVKEFADILGVHRNTIYRYEGAEATEFRNVPFRVAIQLSRKFKVNLYWLAGLSNEKRVE